MREGVPHAGVMDHLASNLKIIIIINSSRIIREIGHISFLTHTHTRFRRLEIGSVMALKITRRNVPVKVRSLISVQ